MEKEIYEENWHFSQVERIDEQGAFLFQIQKIMELVSLAAALLVKEASRSLQQEEWEMA